jgi:hypothetical protein
MCLEQELAETARERKTIIAYNITVPLQTKPKKNKLIFNQKRGYDPDQAICPFLTASFESLYSEVDDQSTVPNAVACHIRNNPLRRN